MKLASFVRDRRAGFGLVDRRPGSDRNKRSESDPESDSEASRVPHEMVIPTRSVNNFSSLASNIRLPG